MNYREFLTLAKSKLSEAKVECGDFSAHAEDFVLQILELPRKKILLEQDETIEPSALRLLEESLERRLQGEPLQYIVSQAWFWKSKFRVGPGVLIPRRETEHLVEYLLGLNVTGPIKVAELGAGSGNIGISLLQEKPDWEWLGFERNPDSLQYLCFNVKALLSEKSQYKILAEDFFGAEHVGAPYDILVSNPPYIAEKEVPTLSKEVQREPRLALVGGETGLEIFERLVLAAPKLLRGGGYFASELGSDQGERAKEIALRHGLTEVSVLKDMAGLDRILVGRKA